MQVATSPRGQPSSWRIERHPSNFAPNKRATQGQIPSNWRPLRTMRYSLRHALSLDSVDGCTHNPKVGGLIHPQESRGDCGYQQLSSVPFWLPLNGGAMTCLLEKLYGMTCQKLVQPQKARLILVSSVGMQTSKSVIIPLQVAKLRQESDPHRC